MSSVFKNGVKLSELFNGTTFNIDINDENQSEPEFQIDLENNQNADELIIPFDKSFDELKSKMNEEIPGVWKKVLKDAPANALQVDFLRHKVTYHYNFYLEHAVYPFDSTYLNRKPFVICNDAENHLDGLTDALSTMKEQEQAYFIITHKKMFKESGCLPRVLPSADILCDLKVVKIEEIGYQDCINQLEEESHIKQFSEAKELVKEGRVRAKFLFNNNSIDDAIKMYKKMVQTIDFSRTCDENEEREKNEILIQIYINMATCYNRRENPNEALRCISLIEEICDISNLTKVLFIKAKAFRMLGDFKEAKVNLKKALVLKPGNPDIIRECEKLESEISKYNTASMRFAKKIIGM